MRKLLIPLVLIAGLLAAAAVSANRGDDRGTEGGEIAAEGHIVDDDQSGEFPINDVHRADADLERSGRWRREHR